MDGRFTNKKRHPLWMNESVVTFEYYAIVKTTLKQNRQLTAKVNKKRKLFKIVQDINLECVNSPNELAIN